jgi:ribosome-associated heat shock protein Hsp15
MSEDRIRIDKWLWAARFYKTRGLAADEIGKGRVSVNGQVAKASRDLKLGDEVVLRQGPLQRGLRVLALNIQRGPASVAQAMYEETADSIAARARFAEMRKQGTEPAQSIEQGRPTKRDRRQLADWQRWSASADDLPKP